MSRQRYLLIVMLIGGLAACTGPAPRGATAEPTAAPATAAATAWPTPVDVPAATKTALAFALGEVAAPTREPTRPTATPSAAEVAAVAATATAWWMDALATARAPAPNTPEGVTRAFYTWYLQGINSTPVPGMTPGPGDYQISPYISEGARRMAEKTIYGGAGYDPFTCLQMKPHSFAIDSAASRRVNANQAIVVVHFDVPGSTLEVPVSLYDGRWEIDWIPCPPLGSYTPTPTR